MRECTFSVRSLRSALFILEEVFMNYNQNYNYSQTNTPRNPKAIVIVFVIVVAVLGIIISNIIGNNENTQSEETTNTDTNNNFYVGETMNYDNIDVTVDSISETQYSLSSNDEKGYIIKVTFTLKNNGIEEFSVDDDCFDIRTEDKNERYTTEQFLFHRSIIAGGQETFWLQFKVPYSMTEKNYIMYFDWGFWHNEQAYHLYNRDGTNAITKLEETDKNIDTNNEEKYEHLFTGDCPVSINATYHTSSQVLSIRAYNQSEKTIVAIKYLIVVYDVYGEVLQKYGYGASSLTATYDKFSIKPNSGRSGEWELRGFSDGKSVDVYVFSVLYEDNTEWGSKDLTVADVKKYAPKTHVTGSYS